jgi:hypothetical protein
VTVKEELHQLIDGLSDEQARDLLEDLRYAADTNGPPLDEEALASLDRGLADIAADRVISVENFEREPPLYKWQIRELERREANLIANPGSVTDWETVKRHVRERNRTA